MTDSTKRRPPKLDLNSITPVEPGPNTAAAIKALRTPKELANDIAIQCVSPAIPTFMTTGAILKAKSIEAQQKRLIAERKSHNLRTPMVSATGQKTPPPTSARKRKPESIEIYPAYMVSKPRINSAPLYRGAYTGGYSATNEAQPSASNNGHGSTSPMGPIRRTTIYLDAAGNRIGPVSASTPSRSRPFTDGEDIGSDSDETGGHYADPEDAALSDAEQDDLDNENAAQEQAALSLAARKQKFLHLCSEMFDLIANPGPNGHTDRGDIEKKKTSLMTSVLDSIPASQPTTSTSEPTSKAKDDIPGEDRSDVS